MREGLLVVIVAGLSTASLAWSIARGQEVPRDRTTALAAAYAAVAPEIPPSASVLHVAVSRDPDGATTERFLAQYALAPRIVSDQAEAAAFAVTAPGAPEAYDHEPALRPFVLVRVTSTGIRLGPDPIPWTG